MNIDESGRKALSRNSTSHRSTTWYASEPTSRKASEGSSTEQKTNVDTTASKDPESKGRSSATPPTPRNVRPISCAFVVANSRADDGFPDNAGSTPAEEETKQMQEIREPWGGAVQVSASERDGRPEE